ncbi:MAG: hypothetical protein GY862_21385 [Gammaproteobacteria bacterium]|nr:hypothetical protein [Gammaproteobacteria bacterium]
MKSEKSLMLLSGESELRLDSAAGNHIDNAQYEEISPYERNQFGLLDKWKKNRIFRSSPTARYNCHGMTFASRRTGIYENTAIEQILREDKYIQINPKDVLPGDVILYCSDEDNIEHSGIVATEIIEMGVPRVISKWGKYAEFVHWANKCPYSLINIKYFRMLA